MCERVASLAEEGEEPEPLTAEQLKAAQEEMEQELKKLIGMESVKQRMRDVCKQEMHDITRAAGNRRGCVAA
eukprot:gene13618-22277_t